jgi:hypothetical protein
VSSLMESKQVGEVVLSNSVRVKVSTFEGRDGKARVDIRIFLTQQGEGRYSGPTKKGLTIPIERVPELVKILEQIAPQ